MTSDPERDLLRELRESEPPAGAKASARALRARTVSHMKDLQARAVVRREMGASWRNRLLVVAALLIPTGALGASLVPWNRLIAARSSVVGPGPSNPHPAPRRHARAVAHAATAPSETPLEVEPARSADAPAPAASTRSVGRRARTTGPAETPRGAPHDSSTLAEENRLMQSALSASRAGDDEGAVRLLRDLLARYPNSVLAQNASVELFRSLSRIGDSRAALQQARSYLAAFPNGMASDEAHLLAGTSPAASAEGPSDAPVR